MACHITGVYDVNRNTTLDGDEYEWVRQWAESLAAANVQGLLFHNNFSKETCDAHQNECITFVNIDYDPRFNPNVCRYFVYREFLQNAIHSIRNLFITDVSDVTLAKNPFTDPYFLEHPTSLFCGDEPTTLDNDWMRAHSAKLRDSIPDFADFETRFANDTLLNCGIIGGAAPVVFEFIRKLCAIHQESNIDNRTAYTGDMGAFNYLARTQYNRQLKHGPPVNTVFKQYERERIDCWFRHK